MLLKKPAKPYCFLQLHYGVHLRLSKQNNKIFGNKRFVQIIDRFQRIVSTSAASVRQVFTHFLLIQVANVARARRRPPVKWTVTRVFPPFDLTNDRSDDGTCASHHLRTLRVPVGGPLHYRRRRSAKVSAMRGRPVRVVVRVGKISHSAFSVFCVRSRNFASEQAIVPPVSAARE